MAVYDDDAVFVVDGVDVWSEEMRNDAVMWSDEMRDDAVDHKRDFSLSLFVSLEILWKILL